MEQAAGYLPRERTVHSFSFTALLSRARALTVPAHSVVFSVLLVSCFSLAGWSRVTIEQLPATEAAEFEQLRYLPRGDVLRAALLGYDKVGADLLWLQIVQVLGSNVSRPAEYAWLDHALDVVTTVDPQFVTAYDLGGGMLTELAGRVERSNRLLRKGVEANPDSWRLPFLLGFNHFFYLHDYASAAAYMAQAARLPGAPAYVPELATRLYAQAHDVTAALYFVEAMLDQATHQPLREALERRKRELFIERDLDRLELAGNVYRRLTDRPLTNVVELVALGLIAAVPQEPFGGAYVVDEGSGKIISTTHSRRLRLFHPGDAQTPATAVGAP